MLSPDIRFEGFTATDWVRFLTLFRPRRTSGESRDPNRPRGGVIAVHADGQLRKLAHTLVGRLRLDDARASWPMTAQELAERHHASWAATVEMGSLERVMDRLGEKTRRGDDFTEQVLRFFSLLQGEVDAGALDVWPRRLAGVPLPTASMIRSSFDAVCPPGHAMGLGLFSDGELWTSVALRRSPGGGFNLIAGPDEIREDMGLLSGDWRRDYRHLVRSLESNVAPLSLGCFAELETFRRLEVDPTPGAWARAVAIRDVVLSPVPAAMAVPLGIDAGRAAFSALRSLAERMDPVGIVGPTLGALRDAAFGPDSDLPSMIGFDPLDMLRKLLSRDD